MHGDRLSARGRFDPLVAEHPAVRLGHVCAICLEPMLVGQVPALMELGPADDDARRRMEQGRPYTAEAAITHDDCLAGG